MTATAGLIAVIVMVIGGFAGYHVRQAQQANADLKVHKQRIPRFRATRNRSGLISLGVAIAAVLVLRVFLFN